MPVAAAGASEDAGLEGSGGAGGGGATSDVIALQAEVAALRKALATSREEALRLRVQLAEAQKAAAAAPLPSADEVAVRELRQGGSGGSSCWPPEPDARDRRRLLDHLRCDAYVQLGPSRIAGVGVFAIRPIPAGVDPFPICNPHLATKEQFCIFSAAELRDIPAPAMEQVKSFFAPLTEDDDWTPQRDDKGEILYGVVATGLNSLNLSWFLNHTEDPNIEFKDAENEGEFNSYVTRRRIEEGEELTADYRQLGREYFNLVSQGG